MITVSEPVQGICVVEFSAPVTEGDCDRFVQERQRLLDEDKTHVLVIRSVMLRPPPGTRRLIAWGRAHRSRIARFTIGYGMVIESGAMRNLVKVLMRMVFIRKPPVHFAKDYNEALQWAGERLAVHGVQNPPAPAG